MRQPLLCIFAFISLMPRLAHTTDYINPDPNLGSISLQSGDTLVLSAGMNATYPNANFQILMDGNTSLDIGGGVSLNFDGGPAIRSLPGGIDTGNIYIRLAGNVVVTNSSNCIDLESSNSSAITMDITGNFNQNINLNAQSTVYTHYENYNTFNLHGGTLQCHDFPSIGGPSFVGHLNILDYTHFVPRGEFTADTISIGINSIINGNNESVLKILTGDLNIPSSTVLIKPLEGVPGNNQTVSIASNCQLDGAIRNFDHYSGYDSFTVNADMNFNTFFSGSMNNFTTLNSGSVLSADYVSEGHFISGPSSSLSIGTWDQISIDFSQANSILSTGAPIANSQYNNADPTVFTGASGQNQTLNLTRSMTLINDSSINDVDLVNVTGNNTEVDLQGIASVNNFSQLTINANSQLNLVSGNVISGTDLNNQGHLRLSDATLSSNLHNQGTLETLGQSNVNGNLTADALSSIQFLINSLNNYSSLNVSGLTSLNDNSGIELISGPNQNYQIGERYPLISSGTLNLPNPNLINVSSNTYPHLHYRLDTSQSPQINVVVEEAASIPNISAFRNVFQQSSTADNLNNNIATLNPDLGNALTKLDAAGYSAPQVFHALSPKTAPAQVVISNLSHNQLINKVNLQLDYNTNLRSGYIAGDEPQEPYEISPLFYVSNLSAKAQGNFAAYKAQSHGLGVMIEHKASSSLRLGFASGMGQSLLRSQANALDRSKVKSYQALVFLNWQRDRWIADCIVASTINKYQNQRYIPLVDTLALSSPRGKNNSFRSKFSYHLPYDKLNLFLLSSFDKNVLSIGKYAEYNAGGLNLASDSQVSNIHRVGLGLKVLAHEHQGQDLLEAQYNYYHDLNRDQSRVLANLVGLDDAFISLGPKNKPSTHKLGLSYRYQMRQSSWSVNYEFERKGYLTRNTIFLNYKFKY